MRRIVIAAALLAAVLAATGLTADEPKKDEPKKPTNKDIGKLMKDTHKGEKTPYARTEAELKKDAPDWEQITKDAKAFADLGAALKALRPDHTAPEKYSTSAVALGKAAGEKDKKNATEAFTGLTQSCGSCHYGGAKAMLK
jgi:cytochrome c556